MGFGGSRTSLVFGSSSRPLGPLTETERRELDATQVSAGTQCAALEYSGVGGADEAGTVLSVLRGHTGQLLQAPRSLT